MKTKTIVTVAFALVMGAMLWVFFKGFGTDPRAVPFMLAGKPAPNFNLTRLDTGEAVTLDSFKGRPLVVNFWSTWCGPCKQEHPVLVWGAKQFSDQAQFIGVVFEDSEENARAFLQRQPTSYPNMSDPNSRMAVDYGCAGVPETYFIDASGNILDKHVGPIDPRTLNDNIRKLVAASAQTSVRTP